MKSKVTNNFELFGDYDDDGPVVMKIACPECGKWLYIELNDDGSVLHSGEHCGTELTIRLEARIEW